MSAKRVVLWQEMTDPEIVAVRDAGAVVVVPVGATEQHGAHLPVDTDTANAVAVAQHAAERCATARVLVIPPVAFGLSPHHRSFSSTIGLRLDTFLRVLGDVCSDLVASGFGKVALVNGHGGNSAALRALVTEMVADGLPVAGVDYWKPSEAIWSEMLRGALRTMGHACEFETALQMALTDEAGSERILVAAAGLQARTDQPWVQSGSADPILPAGAAWSPIFHGDDCGYYGDPARATRDLGIRLLDVVSEGLAGFLDALAVAELKSGVRRVPSR